MTMNRQITLAARPVGAIKESDFAYREAPMPAVNGGEVLVRNLYLSLDPAMRGWMTENRDSYIPPVELGEVMRGLTVGEVVESKNPAYAPGDKVTGRGGWQDYYVFNSQDLAMKIPDGVPIPVTAFVSVLGMTGLTAYFGLLDVAAPKPGETVVVSTAAGAVGSIVGQIAKIHGCRVVGIAGSAEKCRWVTEDLGFDACINYKTENVAEKLREYCPKKIDVYFDNVGGAILNDVLGCINVGARISICGAITQYNATELAPGPANYLSLLTKRSRMQGFIVLDYAPRFMEGVMQLSQWLLEGKLKYKVDVVTGLENAPKAIGKLFDGSNQGKLLIQIANG
ncbi:MAG: NADP-dependent oxidoreductase [Candidatus Hydrogenedentes bacterium]|nr:NADP-dependent oxidoreductase [Candidatus Hydrogenedentota bacterium]